MRNKLNRLFGGNKKRVSDVFPGNTFNFAKLAFAPPPGLSSNAKKSKENTKKNERKAKENQKSKPTKPKSTNFSELP